MTYKTHYSRDEKNDDVFEVHDPEGTVLIVLGEPADADELVEHLNEPRGGKYSIEDLSDDQGALFELLDPDGDTVIANESRGAFESLLTHLHRHH
ncbi:hypothetical protein [Stenotrophomonas sp. GD03657]|uniref:hypothetical protein n=1 Tax=Stenotrophomonas sp. GD03657 TaxID=2975363 RepID=UPI00244C020B|nr:hypothetical protein [Stenotrophomonas sp. GD03657]MDH2154100.1 hypothetical protein [Stenotrophomonas sp. GD03657]